MELQAAFGKLVRREREARDLSIEALAHEAGLSYSYFGSMERGRRNPSLIVIFAVAAALRLPPEALISEISQSVRSSPEDADA